MVVKMFPFAIFCSIALYFTKMLEMRIKVRYCIFVVGYVMIPLPQNTYIFIHNYFFDVTDFYCEEFPLKLNEK